MASQTVQYFAAVIFALALVHTFSTKYFEHLAHTIPRHAGIFHLLGEVEVVFGFWAIVLALAIAVVDGGQSSLQYLESRQYTEPLFVFVVMVVAASRPVLLFIQHLIRGLARLLPVPSELAQVWLCLAALPLLGSYITEPAAMTVAALALAPILFEKPLPEWKKYAALGTLFVNISIGGTLTSFAAPPVLMVAGAWGWDSAFMLKTFGWKAATAVLFNASILVAVLGRNLGNAKATQVPPPSASDAAAIPTVPLMVTLIHLGFLAAVVLTAHHPVVFIGLFLLFMGFVQAYKQHQSPLILKEALLVGFFLAGLVVLGGLQQWWLQPIVSQLSPQALFFGTLGLTGITDNAALTYLGSLIDGLSDLAKYMLVAGAVAGAGLTVIANAPNPAGVALLKHGFKDEAIGAVGLLAGAALPTLMAACAFLLL